MFFLRGQLLRYRYNLDVVIVISSNYLVNYGLCILTRVKIVLCSFRMIRAIVDCSYSCQVYLGLFTNLIFCYYTNDWKVVCWSECSHEIQNSKIPHAPVWNTLNTHQMMMVKVNISLALF